MNIFRADNKSSLNEIKYKLKHVIDEISNV